MIDIDEAAALAGTIEAGPFFEELARWQLEAAGRDADLECNIIDDVFTIACDYLTE